jgi:alpha-glucosidase (family GH31 glycosyl hydrolase)
VIDNYKLYDLPLDAIWSDIDYLDNNKDFKYDQQNFKSLPNFVKSLHENNQKYVPIIESGIARRPY